MVSKYFKWCGEGDLNSNYPFIICNLREIRSCTSSNSLEKPDICHANDTRTSGRNYLAFSGW
jgi:hypothetical protein